MSDIIDINVAQTVEEVTINVVDNVIQVNINQVNGGGGIESVVAGTNITVDNTDPLNPIINANADAVTSVNSDTGAVIVDLESVLSEDNVSTLPIDANIIYSNGNLIADEAGTLTSNSILILKQSPTQQKTLLSGNYINANQQEYILPDKSVGAYFLATTDDIPAPITIDATPTDGSSNAVSSNGVFDALATKVSKSDYTPAHSILVQQSGTGTPTALSVGNNTLVGRLSGGGSDINDLSVSDVRTLLDIDTDLALKQDKVTGVSDTEIGYLDGVTSAIQTQLNSKQPILIKQGLTELTGVTGVNVLASLLIPANWISSGDGIEIFVIPIKSVTASAINYSIYSDTTINGTSKNIATGLSLSTANRVGIFQRICVLDATTLRNSTIAAAAQPLPIAANSPSSTTVFDPTVANYITITVNPTVSSEVVGFNQFFIRKL